MADQTPALTPPVNPMDALFEKYGSDGVMDGLHSTENNAAPVKEQPSAPVQPSPPSPSSPASSVGGDEEKDGARDEGAGAGEDDDLELDAATIQALGLEQEEEPTPLVQQSDDGTPELEIDPARLAATLGYGPEDLSVKDGKLMVRTKVDGEEATVSFDELRAGYQLRKSYTRQNEAFLREKQEWEQLRQAKEAQADQLAQQAMTVLDAEEKALNTRYTRNWEQLRQEDPAEYAAQIADYNQQLNAIQGRKAALHQQAQQRQKEQNDRISQQLQQRAVEGEKVLRETFRWETPESWETSRTRLAQYMLNELGLTPEQIGATDAKALVSTEKARRWDELQARLKKGKAQAKQAPAEVHKVPQGKASKPGSTSRRRKLQDARERHAKKGTVDSAAAVFDQLNLG